MLQRCTLEEDEGIGFRQNIYRFRSLSIQIQAQTTTLSWLPILIEVETERDLTSFVGEELIQVYAIKGTRRIQGVMTFELNQVEKAGLVEPLFDMLKFSPELGLRGRQVSRLEPMDVRLSNVLVFLDLATLSNGCRLDLTGRIQLVCLFTQLLAQRGRKIRRGAHPLLITEDINESVERVELSGLVHPSLFIMVPVISKSRVYLFYGQRGMLKM